MRAGARRRGSSGTAGEHFERGDTHQIAGRLLADAKGDLRVPGFRRAVPFNIVTYGDSGQVSLAFAVPIQLLLALREAGSAAA